MIIYEGLLTFCLIGAIWQATEMWIIGKVIPRDIDTFIGILMTIAWLIYRRKFIKSQEEDMEENKLRKNEIEKNAQKILENPEAKELFEAVLNATPEDLEILKQLVLEIEMKNNFKGMKNYRQIRRMQIEEWEDDNEWKGRRLAFIFEMMYEKTDVYLRIGLNEEKRDFYNINKSDVARIAEKTFYGKEEMVNE